MGKTLCKIPGGQISPDGYEHLATRILNRQPFSDIICIKAGTPHFIATFYFCSICTKRWNIRTELSESPELMWETYEEAIAITQPVCRICFDELKTD